MRFFLGTLAIIVAIFYSFMATAKDCAPPITNLHSIVPQSWIVPGSYKVWNTSCVNYVFNYIDNPADISWFSPEHAGWERGTHVSRYGLGTSVDRDFKAMIDLEGVSGSVCLVTFTRKNSKIGCLRYNIEEDQMEMVGDIHANSDVRVLQSFSAD